MFSAMTLGCCSLIRLVKVIHDDSALIKAAETPMMITNIPWLARGNCALVVHGMLLTLLVLLFLVLFVQSHGHHTPGQVLKSLAVGQRVLGLGVQSPDLGREGVLFGLFRSLVLL